MLKFSSSSDESFWANDGFDREMRLEWNQQLNNLKSFGSRMGILFDYAIADQSHP